MGEDKGESRGPVETERRSAGGETDWLRVVAVKVARKDGGDQAGLADGLERSGEGEEGGKSKGTPKRWVECFGSCGQHLPSGRA